MERVVAREGGTRVVMGIRWRNGLNVFNMDTEIKLPKKVVHSGSCWAFDGGMEESLRSMGKWINSQRRLYKGGDGHSMEGWTKCSQYG